MAVLFLLVGLLSSFGSAMAVKSIKEELDEAKKAKKTVFLVVIENHSKAESAMKMAQQAQKQVKESIVLSLNRDDQSNKEVVSSLGVASAPVPMIMVIGMNGIATGGLPEKEATVDKLVSMVPSPKKVEALAYLNENKPVFLIAYKKGFTDHAAVIDNCKAAITRLKSKAAYVEVDMDDAREKSLLTQVGVNFKANTTQIIVFNASGKNSGSFSGITDPGKLVTAATAAPKSCCPKPGPGCAK